MNEIKEGSKLDQLSNSSLPLNSTSNLTANDSEDFVLELLRAQAGINVLSRLIDIDPFSLTKPRRIDYLAALEKQSGWLQALMQNAIVAVAGDQPTEAESMWSGVDDAEREEVEKYIDSRLATLEVILNKTSDAVARGRERLAGAGDKDVLSQLANDK